MPNSRRVSRRQWWGAIVYSMVATAVIVGLVVWNTALYRNAVASCEQQNVARVAANSGAQSLRSFLGIAIQAAHKRAATVDAKQPGRRALDLQGARLYAQVRDAQHTVPVLDCSGINRQPWTIP